jgi:hypothetical protein
VHSNPTWVSPLSTSYTLTTDERLKTKEAKNIEKYGKLLEMTRRKSELLQHQSLPQIGRTKSGGARAGNSASMNSASMPAAQWTNTKPSQTVQYQVPRCSQKYQAENSFPDLLQLTKSQKMAAKKLPRLGPKPMLDMRRRRSSLYRQILAR